MMNSLKEKIDELNGLIVQGKAMEGFEKFYDTNVVMQENEMEPTIASVKKKTGKGNRNSSATWKSSGRCNR